MTYRTENDKRRAVYILAAIAVAAVLALSMLGNGREACNAVRGADTCAYALR